MHLLKKENLCLMEIKSVFLKRSIENFESDELKKSK